MKFGFGKRVVEQCSLSVFFSVPWCCVLPAVLSLGGLAAGLGALQYWSIKLIPFFFALSVFFLGRALWVIYVRHQGNPTSVTITWISTIIAALFWSVRFGIIPLNHLIFV